MAVTKYSKQRKLIYDAVKENYTHPTADAIYNELKERLPSLSLGTVYRNLNQLAESGVILRLHLGEGADHYDCQTVDHYHMRCTNCGELIDIMVPHFSEIDERIERLTGNRISGHQIVFEGVCERCQRAEAHA